MPRAPKAPGHASPGPSWPGVRTPDVRPSAAARGYGHRHRTRFRTAVLARDPTCVRCHEAPSHHADHWPLTRRDLVAQDLDPDEPQHGRGLCARCHAAVTAEQRNAR